MRSDSVLTAGHPGGTEGAFALSPEHISALIWMVRANRAGIGLHWDSIRYLGPMPSCEELVKAGYARRPEYAKPSCKRGYWITPAGRSALSATTDGGER
jgi:hypothetical protein